MNSNILKFCCIISSMYSLPSKSVHIYGACIMYWDYSYSFSYPTPLQHCRGWMVEKSLGCFDPDWSLFLTLFCRPFHIDTNADVDADRWLYNELELHILSLFFRYVMKRESLASSWSNIISGDKYQPISEKSLNAWFFSLQLAKLWRMILSGKNYLLFPVSAKKRKNMIAT